MRYHWHRVDRQRPNRCPRCWSLSPSAHGRGRARLWFIYRCDSCRVRWLRLGGFLMGDK